MRAQVSVCRRGDQLDPPRADRRRLLQAALLDLGRLSFIIAVLYALTAMTLLPRSVRRILRDRAFLILQLDGAAATLSAWVIAIGATLPFFLLAFVLGRAVRARSVERSTKIMLLAITAAALFFSAVSLSWNMTSIPALLSWLSAGLLEPAGRPDQEPAPASTRIFGFGAVLWGLQGAISLGVTLLTLFLLMFAHWTARLILMDDEYDLLSNGIQPDYRALYFKMIFKLVLVYFPVFLSPAALWVSFSKRAPRHSAATMLALSLFWALVFFLTARDPQAIMAAIFSVFCAISLLLLPKTMKTEASLAPKRRCSARCRADLYGVPSGGGSALRPRSAARRPPEPTPRS